jgi:hypothetical protein
MGLASGMGHCSGAMWKLVWVGSHTCINVVLFILFIHRKMMKVDGAGPGWPRGLIWHHPKVPCGPRMPHQQPCQQ